MKIIVIGGLSAGPSAAAKARRENETAEIILFEKGSAISYATCGIPYALSGIIETRAKLIVVEANLLKVRFNIDVHLDEEILKVDCQNKFVISTKGSYKYDKLMFATGASSIVPPIKNIETTSNWSTCRSLADFDKIMKEGIVSAVTKITVVGAGLIGVELAENLIEAGKEVTLIEGGNQILPMWTPKFAFMAEQALQENGVRVLKSVFVNEFVAEKDKVSSVIVGAGEIIESNYVILSAGIRPNTKLLIDNGAKHLPNGALLVNEKMETSIPSVYAAGDNVAIKNLQTNTYDYFPLGTHSNKGGRTAGANIAGANIEFKGAYKTAILKVFNYTLARTGMNPSSLIKHKINYKTVLTIAGATPSYYPNAKDLIIEIYYHAATHKILGAELFGEHGVDKRVDVLSTAIYAGLKIEDLAQLDLAYAPPFSPAKDPLVVTSFSAENEIRALTEQISVENFQAYINKASRNEYVILDVRTRTELKQGFIPNSISIPLDELRTRLNELDNLEIPIYIYCAKGLRGYLASLILKQANYKQLYNIAGGFKMWKLFGGTLNY